MSTVALTRLIEAPADEVWRVFVDLPARPEWLCTVREVEMLTTGGFSTGTRWREHRIMPDGSTAIAEFEVEEAIPVCRFTVVSAGIGVDYRTTYTFTGLAPRRRRPGCTAVTVHQRGTPTARAGRLLALLLGGLAARAMETALRRDLADLAGLVAPTSGQGNQRKAA